MEGGEGGMMDEIAGPLVGMPLPDLDRTALASHCAAVAQHMSAMARLFDPSYKAPAGVAHKKARKDGEDGGKDKPKRELTAYNLFMQSRLQQVKTERPELSHTQAFAEAAHAWKTDASNPKCAGGDEAAAAKKAQEAAAGGAGPAEDDEQAAHKKHKKHKKDEPQP